VAGTGDVSVYVYGVLPASDQARISVGGVEGAKVRTIQHGGLAALVSSVEADALAAARELRAHWRVLEEASKATTVLPVRFGTVMESEDAVRERMLEPNSAGLTELLDELAGRVQLNVKGDYDEERMLSAVVREVPAVRTLRERVQKLSDAAGYYDRIRLGEVVAAEVARRREDDTALVLARLEPRSVATSAEQPHSPNAAFNLAFLVDGSEVDAFSEAVGQLRTELGERVRLDYVGPLPPYSFAETDLGAGAEAWA
jgi:Gas vesicle synthesis protein GvpL/GvpF